MAAAARWTHETGLHAEDEPRYPREPGYLVLARVLLAQERPAEALALLDRLYTAAAAQDRTGSLIEIGALRALALAACGQDADAVNVLADALTLACPRGHVRVFADEGPPMAALLTRLIAAQRVGSGFQGGSGFQAAASVPLGYLARLRCAFGAEPAAPHAAAVPGLIDPLTSRELEVLDAGGRKVEQAIAGQSSSPRHRQEASATCSASSARSTAPRPSPGAGTGADSACHAAAGSRERAMRCGGGVTWRPGRISPRSSNTITPLHSRLHPCSG